VSGRVGRVCPGIGPGAGIVMLPDAPHPRGSHAGGIAGGGFFVDRGRGWRPWLPGAARPAV